jgi:hypothetical protein
MFRLLLIGEAGLVVAVSAFYLVRPVSVQKEVGHEQPERIEQTDVSGARLAGCRLLP